VLGSQNYFSKMERAKVEIGAETVGISREFPKKC